MTHCPSELGLEAYLLAPERSAAKDHVTGCAACQSRLLQMRALGEEFEREVFPVTLRSFEGGPRVARPRWRRWALVASPIAAAAALVAVLLASDIWGEPELGLAVLLERPTGAQVLKDGAEVPASASLRFAVHPRSPCSLWLLSVDAAGDIVRLFPPRGDREGERVIHPARRQELSTAAVLDGKEGPQRIFAVCTRTPVPWNTVKQAAAQTLEKGAAVRGFRSIDGLPEGSTQSTVLLEKRS